MEVEDEPAVESLGVRSFLASRVQEINALSAKIASTEAPLCKGLAFQQLPNHMRRRAVSHNVKRVPHSIRQIHINQIRKAEQSSGPKKKPKRPSRKFRRRKSNLLEEYNRRQRTNKWLETHIWHAKRFHMQNLWNYRIPTSPTDKGYRALYRAASKHCAMRDISFYTCLQLEGPFDLISSKISSAFAPKSCNPLSLASEMYKTGEREGSMYFFKCRSYPFGYIGKVKFQWKRDQKVLWLWVHPAHKEEIIEELCNEFDLDEEISFKAQTEVEEPMEVDDPKGTEKKETLPIDELKLKPKKLLKRIRWKNVTEGVILTDLEGVFNRVRLYGPLSTSVLKETLHLLSPDKLNQFKTNDKKFWWIDYYSEESEMRKEFLQLQCDMWKKLNSTTVPCNSIFPFTVRDPRVFIPQKRTKTKDEFIEDEEPEMVSREAEEDKMSPEDNFGLEKKFEEFQKSCSVVESPLYSVDCRSRLVQEKMTDEEFCNRRSELLIPGSMIDLGAEENQVPLMLIHRPSTNFRFQNGGWDLIIPAGWAMQFWIALSYRAVRACGLRDAIHFEFEAGTIHVANEDGFSLSPDSASGKIEAQARQMELHENYFKQAPAKRSNLIKLGCPFPFEISWPILLEMNEPRAKRGVFYVLREGKILRKLQELIQCKKTTLNQTKFEELIGEVPEPSNCLVGVRLIPWQKGVIEAGAVICIPSESDFNFLLECSKSKFLKLDEKLLQEPPKDDKHTHEQRAQLREKHQQFMSFLRCKRKKLRKKEDQSACGGKGDTNPYDSKEVSEFYNKSMEDLWLPDSKEVLESMSKTPIGFVVFGNETYSVAKCTGLGYCSLTGFQRWFTETKCTWNQKNLVLIRNCRNSLIYRLATLEVCALS